jgi:hypothetical protein
MVALAGEPDNLIGNSSPIFFLPFGREIGYATIELAV